MIRYALLALFCFRLPAQNTAYFPTRDATINDMTVAFNNYRTQLSSAMGLSDTVVHVKSVTGAGVPIILFIEQEAVKCTGISGLTFSSCTRAFDNTTGATHKINATVVNSFGAFGYNQLTAEVIAIEAFLTAGGGGGGGLITSVFGRTGAVVAQSGDYTTSLVTEGTNLYYTDARARAALSATSPLTYNSGTGSFGLSFSLSGNGIAVCTTSGTLGSSHIVVFDSAGNCVQSACTIDGSGNLNCSGTVTANAGTALDFTTLNATTVVNGQLLTCSDCTASTDPCTGGGGGALVFGQSNQWRCL